MPDPHLPTAPHIMARTDYLQQFTIRQLRIYGRKQGVAILQKWTKPQLIAAIAAAGF